MRLEQNFVVRLDVEPIVFDADREVAALAQLRTTYAGRCFRDTFIVKVLGLVPGRMSDTRINRLGDTPGQGTVEVEFRADCFRLYPGDPIAGMVVGVRGAVVVGAASPRLGLPPIVVTLNEPNDIFTVDRIVPVEVVAASHLPMQETISAIARPLACRQRGVVWTATKGGPVEPEKLAALGKRLENALAGRAALAGAGGDAALARAFFLKLLNSFLGDPPPLPAGFEPREVGGGADLAALLAAMAPGTRWVRPLEKEYDWAGVCRVADGAALPDHYEEAQAAPEAILAMAQNEILGGVGVVDDLTRVYHTKALLTQHKPIFLLMRQKQRAFGPPAR